MKLRLLHLSSRAFTHGAQHDDRGSCSQREQENWQGKRASGAQQDALLHDRGMRWSLGLGRHALDAIEAGSRAREEGARLVLEAPDDLLLRGFGSPPLPACAPGPAGFVRFAELPDFGRARHRSPGCAALIGVGNFRRRRVGRAFAVDRRDGGGSSLLGALETRALGARVSADDLSKPRQRLIALLRSCRWLAKNAGRNLAQLPLDGIEIGELHRRRHRARESSRRRYALTVAHGARLACGRDAKILDPSCSCPGLIPARGDIRGGRIDEISQFPFEFIKINTLDGRFRGVHCKSPSGPPCRSFGRLQLLRGQ